MIRKLVESDRPRSLREKLAEYLARPPQPVLRFFGGFKREGNTFMFNVRNGLPLPLLYGVYISGDNGDYQEATDHIGPFSTDNWMVVFDRMPNKISIRVGLVPFEIQTDKAEVTF